MSPTCSEGVFGTRSAGVLRLLTGGMVSGTLIVFTKYEVVIRQRQLFLGELIALSPQFNSRDDRPGRRRRELRRAVARARPTALTGLPPALV